MSYPIDLSQYHPVHQSAILATLNRMISEHEGKVSAEKQSREQQLDAAHRQVLSLEAELATAQHEYDRLRAIEDQTDPPDVRNTKRLQNILSLVHDGSADVFCHTSGGVYGCDESELSTIVSPNNSGPYALYYVHPEDLPALQTSPWSGFATID